MNLLMTRPLRAAAEASRRGAGARGGAVCLRGALACAWFERGRRWKCRVEAQAQLAVDQAVGTVLAPAAKGSQVASGENRKCKSGYLACKGARVPGAKYVP